MIVAIDIGNTDSVFGFFQKGKLVLERRASSDPRRTEDEIWIFFKHFCELAKITPEGIRGIVISSVVPDLTRVFIVTFKKYLKAQPVIVSGNIDTGITIPYDDPSKLGADRICAVVAALKKFGGPAIVVDFGTATTYDILSSNGEYLGGVIAPGVRTAAKNLLENTAQLPNIELQFPETIIGKTTVEAIQSGVMYGAVDAFEGMIRRLRRVAGKYATVIATGGYAAKIGEMSNEIKYMEPHLVLEGARIIFERVSKKVKK
jgi:type III pantothenate kinase